MSKKNNGYNYNPSSEQLEEGGFDFDILDDYHYISIGATNVGQLKKAGIIDKKINVDEFIKNKPDGLILQGKNKVVVLVESKRTGLINSKEDAL